MMAFLLVSVVSSDLIGQWEANGVTRCVHELTAALIVIHYLGGEVVSARAAATLTAWISTDGRTRTQGILL